MKRLPIFLSLLTLSVVLSPAALISSPLMAQEESAETEENSVKVAQVKAKEKAQAKDTDTKKDKVDDYQATEEISEDLSVSYPVDI